MSSRGYGLEEIKYPDNLPSVKREIISDFVHALRSIPGIAAIALGGSYARGAQHLGSDLDLALCYFESTPFSIDRVREIATGFNVEGPSRDSRDVALVVTDFYVWGPWVNGGAWIHTRAGKVELIYRNIDQVRRVIHESQDGKSSSDYFQQPAYGFHSVIYLAEASSCVPLYDPSNVLAELKAEVTQYPPALKKTIVEGSLWGSEFTLVHARKFAERGDVYNTVGCLTRALGYLTQGLFAINETYFISDKEALERIESFRLVPPGYRGQVTRLLARPGSTGQELAETVRALDKLFRNVADLAGELYKPKFEI